MSTRTRTSDDQLRLSFGEGPETSPSAAPDPDGRRAHAAPMLPGETSAPFDDERWFFEPWWPGVLATLELDHGAMHIAADQLTDPTEAFQDLRTVPAQVSAVRARIPGTLLVLDADGRPDADALRRRLRDPDDRPGRGAFIAADLLERGGRSLVDRPFSERRAALIDLVRDGDRFLVSRGLHGEGLTLAAAAASMGIAAISARRLDAPWTPGIAQDAWLRTAVTGGALGPARPLLVLLQRLPLD